MRIETREDSGLFGELLRSLLEDGIAVRFQAHGRSMYPAIVDGNFVQVESGSAKPGDVAMIETPDGFRVHRVVGASDGNSTRGDCCFGEDPHPAAMIGSVSFGPHRRIPRQRFASRFRRWIAGWRGHF